MATAGPQRPNLRLTDLPPRVAAFVVLVAFIFQSCVIQAHFHGVPEHAGGSVESVVANLPAPANLPFDGNPLDCPFCQAYAHAGTFFTPMAPILFGPAGLVERVASFFIPSAIPVAIARNWRSRAPPKH